MNKFPILEEIGAETEVLAPIRPLSLLLLEKMQKLRIQGYSDEEAERLSKPKPIDMDEVMERIMKFQEKELRRLAKLNPQRKPVKLKKADDFPDLTEIKISTVDLRPDLKWMATS